MRNSIFHQMNIRKKKASKGGFTLVEVIVTLIITVIVVAVSSTLIITGTNIFARSAQRDIQDNIAETVLSFVSNQILYAYNIAEKGSTEQIYEGIGLSGAVLHIINPDDGRGSDKGYLYFRRDGDTQVPLVNVFGNNFYQNYTIGLRIDITDRNVSTSGSAYADITVTVYNNAKIAVLARSTSKPLLNFQYRSKTVGQEGVPIDIDPRPTT